MSFFIKLLFTVSPELIDTLWNVNKDMVFKSNNEFRELIDTLWNVNFIPRIITVNVIELIDTLWNVNTHGKMPLGRA